MAVLKSVDTDLRAVKVIGGELLGACVEIINHVKPGIEALSEKNVVQPGVVGRHERAHAVFGKRNMGVIKQDKKKNKNKPCHRQYILYKDSNIL